MGREGLRDPRERSTWEDCRGGRGAGGSGPEGQELGRRTKPGTDLVGARAQPTGALPRECQGEEARETSTAQLGDWAHCLEPARCLAGPWALRAPEGGEGVTLLTHPLHPRLLTRSL